LSDIDLQYDPTFSEVDSYGNETKLKSVVRFKNGDYRLIFDLWFRYL
jgi:mRNA-degrading endonuclease RelE of RelBE toxin-antitoxin system